MHSIQRCYWLALESLTLGYQDFNIDNTKILSLIIRNLSSNRIGRALVQYGIPGRHKPVGHRHNG